MPSTAAPLDVTISIRTGRDRAALVRRTYGLVFATVLVTIGAAAYGLSRPPLMRWVVAHPFITFCATFAPLVATLALRPAASVGLAMVFLFAGLEGLALSPMIAVQFAHDPRAIAHAGLLAGTTFAVLTAYAWTSRRDFSAWGSFFTVGLWVLVATSLLRFVLGNTSPSLWLAAVTVLVMSGLLVFDTWRLKNLFGPDQYVQAAVAIYLDLINLFLGTLRLVRGRSG